LEDLGRDVTIILKRVFKKQDGGVGRIDLDQNRDSWWAVVNAVMNPRASQRTGNFLTTGETISFLLEVNSSTASDRRNSKA
jgi:hypothetical protein